MSGKLPAGWEEKKLGEVCKVIAGQSPEGKHFNSQGNGLPFYQGKKEFTEKYLAEPTTWTTEITKEAIKGDILMSVRAPVGPVNFSNARICIGRGLAAIRTSTYIDSEFLFDFLVKHESQIIGNVGAVFASISKTQIENISLPIPPLPEQKRIVAVLDEAFAAIAKAKDNAEESLGDAREIFESYLEEVFRKGTRGNAENAEWEKKKLGEVCDLFQGIAINAKTKHALVAKSELPLLRIKDLKHNTEEQYIDPDNYPPNALVHEDDIIYTRTGSLGLVFRGRRGVLHNNSFKITPRKMLDPDFLFIWLQNPVFKSKILTLASKAAQPDITHALFKEQMIDIPPLPTQRRIVSRLDALSAETKRLEAIYRQKIADLDELKKSILQKAFSGEL